MTIIYAVLNLMLLGASLRPGHSGQIETIEGYRPKYVPSILKGIKPIETICRADSVRGYRTITTKWEVEQPLIPFVRTLANQWTTPDVAPDTPDERILTRRGSYSYAVRDDRALILRTQIGRSVWRELDGGRVQETIEGDRFTTVYLTERPLPVGKMPTSWPKAATRGIDLPKGIPGLPLVGIKQGPSEVEPGGSAEGTTWILTWYIHESEETAFPRFIGELKSRGWSIRLGSDETRATPPNGVDSRATIGWIGFIPRGSLIPMVPSGWCAIRMLYVAR